MYWLACIGSNESIAIKNFLEKDCGWLINNLDENNLGQQIINVLNKQERLEKGINAKNKINEYKPEIIFKCWKINPKFKIV